MAMGLVKRYEGQILDVLIEKYDDKRKTLSGRSSQNKLLHLVGGPELIGKTVPVKVIQAFPNTLRGEILNS
jgi:tRNA-2-methylthio-N6-dimethylallyladenosine synthase